MLTFVTGDIALHRCDALLFTCIEDFPARLHDKFPRVLEFRKALELKESWGPGRIFPQMPPQGSNKNIIVHADLGDDPETVRNLVRVVNNLKPLAAKIQERFDREHMDAIMQNPDGPIPILRRFRSIALPRIGESMGYGWREVREILKMEHSEPNPPHNELEKAFHVEVYETDEEGARPRR